MEGENSTTKMEAIMKACGGTIKWTGGENYTMKVENLHIREIGSKINSTDMEKYLMIIPLI